MQARIFLRFLFWPGISLVLLGQEVLVRVL
jgi:hypothetical protein